MLPAQTGNIRSDGRYLQAWDLGQLDKGRRARHAASMQGPDYTHWHGTYDLDMQFYTRMFPELEHLIDEGTHNGKGDAAQVLAAKLDEVLNSDDHKWYLDKLDHEEKSNGIRPLKVKDALRQVVI